MSDHEHYASGLPVHVPTEGLPVRCKRCGHRGVAWPLDQSAYWVEWELELEEAR